MFVDKLKDYGRSFYSLLGERRKAERVEFECSITVSCKNRYGQLTSHVCKCVNISDKGIGFVSPEALIPNSDIYVHSETHNLRRFARIKYCTQKADVFHVGGFFQ